MTEPGLWLPLIILVARIVETSLETIRTIYINRGHTNLAAGIGVVKVAIWLLSTGLVLTNLQNLWGVLAYVAGYAIGTVIGMRLEERISIGSVVVRVFVPGDPLPVMNRFGGMGYGITRLDGTGYLSSEVALLFMVVPRANLKELLGILKNEYPHLLYTVEDIRKGSEESRIFHGRKKSLILRFFGME
ncbi:MAG: hypothetical protein A4E38_01085 [Methanoregulaceae archaeon PtaB.Bin108]|nr:MAG: hypothetical protein A4E38_01085 [Methanoregulaceae archaeon PtaB.Bin108]OPY43037.1 MAG: hypothetical protein A4E42_01464 [Methanoregulaceae archaeon PtaU1.Bin222]